MHARQTRYAAALLFLYVGEWNALCYNNHELFKRKHKEGERMKGTIIGDIIGSPYEFAKIPVKNKDFVWFAPACHVTDDTVTTIAVAAALQEGKETRQGYIGPLRRQLKYWCRLYPNAGFGARFKQWFMSDEIEPYGSYANGAAMRVAPAAWVGQSLDEVQALAEITALVTHDNDEAVQGAVAVASAIYLGRMKTPKEEIRAYLQQYFYPLTQSLDAVRPAYAFTCRTKDSVPQALEAFLESTDFVDAINNAVSLGGDTDTQAAIAGAVAEAYYGVPEPLWQQAKAYLPKPMQQVLAAFAAVYMKKQNQ